VLNVVITLLHDTHYTPPHPLHPSIPTTPQGMPGLDARRMKTQGWNSSATAFLTFDNVRLLSTAATAYCLLPYFLCVCLSARILCPIRVPFSFHQVRVPSSNLIGEENMGFMTIMHQVWHILDGSIAALNGSIALHALLTDPLHSMLF
jgi:alkylation response protein AidB-like acyl-CoA dehydrogenase